MEIFCEIILDLESDLSRMKEVSENIPEQLEYAVGQCKVALYRLRKLVVSEGAKVRNFNRFFLDSEMWVESTQQIKGKFEEVKIIKNRLDKVTSKIQDIYNQLESMGQPFDIFTIRSRFLGQSNRQGLMEIFDLVGKNVEATLGKDYSYGTLKHYRTTKKRLEEFIKTKEGRKDLPLSSINYNFLKSFDVCLKKTYHMSTNTTMEYHKQTKKVLNVAIAMNHLTKDPL